MSSLTKDLSRLLEGILDNTLSAAVDNLILVVNSEIVLDTSAIIKRELQQAKKQSIIYFDELSRKEYRGAKDKR